MIRAVCSAALLLTSCATVPGARPDSKPEAASSAPVPKPLREWKQQRPVVIRHATILPASSPAITDGAISFAEGRIIAVGKNADVPTPEGAEEIDGTGLFVSPGVIDSHSHLGVYASPASFANNEGNEMTEPVTSQISAEHSFWPQDPGLRRAAAGGVTSLLVLPGSANLIGGRGYPVKLHFGRSAAEMRFPGAKDSLKMACGENPRRVYGSERKSPPATRMANVAGYRQAFLDARDYAAHRAEWAKKAKKDKDGAGPEPKRDLKLETLAEVMAGNILVQNHCYRADEMEVMLQVADEMGYQIRSFHHAVEAYKLRDRLAEKGVATSTWADWWGFKLEAWDGIPENLGLLSSSGARSVVHSDSQYGIQRLNQEAAKALAYARAAGMQISDDEAIRWFTLNPAWVMGVDDRTGSLEAGKMADVVLWNAHPLSHYARAQRVWADGVVTYDWSSGPSVPSDFELDGLARASARLVSMPAARPALQTAACDGDCGKTLEVKTDRCTAFRDVTVITDGKSTKATVVVEKEKISRVGADAAVPSGCRAIDGQGRVLTAGLVDSFTQLGLYEVGQEDSTQDQGPRGDEARKPIHAALRAADSVNPASVTFPVARGGGITTAVTVPSNGLIPGQSAYVSTDGAIRQTSVAMHVNLGITGRDAISSSRAHVLERLRELLFDAREYGKRRQDFEQNRMRDLSASRLDLEALQPVVAGKLPVIVNASRASDIRAAIVLAREFGLKLAIAGADEAWLVAPELAEAKVPVILLPSQNLPASFDSLYSRQDSAALLQKAGVKVIISTLNEAYQVRNLRQEAANAVSWGLPYFAAIDAITRNAAEVFGLDGGRVAAGATADVVLWSGDPLEASSRPLGVWIRGAQQTLESRQTGLFEKYRTLN